MVTKPCIIHTITIVTPTTTTTTTTSVISITTRLRAARTSVRIPVEDCRRQTRPDRLWGPPSLYFNGYRKSFPRYSSRRVTLSTRLHLQPYGTVYELPTWLIADGCNTDLLLNLLKPKDIYIYIYICRTAALTSRRYILNIYSTNLLLLVFSPWAGLGRDQISVRRLVWLWYAASGASS